MKKVKLFLHIKKLPIVICFLLSVFSLKAQENAQYKKWEHNLYVGAGRPFFSDISMPEKPLTLKIGYGLNYYIKENISLMLGVSNYLSTENFGDTKIGGDDDWFEFVDIPLTAHYHIKEEKGTLSFGFGPVLSICSNKDSYYVDAEPSDYLNGQIKIKTFNLLLQPSIRYKYKHLIVGAEGNIGTIDMIKHYDGRIKGSKYIHSLVFTVGLSL